jgi:hypothetical protein
MKMKFGSWLAAAIIAPFILMSVEAWLNYHFKFVGAVWWGYAELALPVIVGLFCLWQLPVSKMKRAILTIVFVPVSIGALIYYALIFACVVFGDCL